MLFQRDRTLQLHARERVARACRRRPTFERRGLSAGANRGESRRIARAIPLHRQFSSESRVRSAGAQSGERGAVPASRESAAAGTPSRSTRSGQKQKTERWRGERAQSRARHRCVVRGARKNKIAPPTNAATPEISCCLVAPARMPSATTDATIGITGPNGTVNFGGATAWSGSEK
jgi:hypothetical protein